VDANAFVFFTDAHEVLGNFIARPTLIRKRDPAYKEMRR
jgi:hypothetical protein